MATAAAQDLREVLASAGTKRIGALVFWTLNGVDIPRSKLKAQLGFLGLDSALGREPTPRALLATATRHTMTRRKGILCRKIGEGWGIVVEREEDGRLAHEHVLTVTADETGPIFTWVNESEPDREALQKAGHSDIKTVIRQAFEHARGYVDTQELSDALVIMFQGTVRNPMLGALSLREKGGLYFVPEDNVDKALRVSQIVKENAGRSELNVFAITGEDDNLQQAAAAAKRGFSNQLNELREEITTFRESLEKQSKVASDRSLQIRSERFKALRERVGLFSQVLGDIAGELTTEIDQARDKLIAELEAVG